MKVMKVIIVLGKRLNHTYACCDILLSRLNKAIEIFNRDAENTIIIVTGGFTSSNITSEAFAMKKYLIQQGIPEYKIFEEKQATNTIENAYYTKNLLDQLRHGKLTYQEVNHENFMCNYYGCRISGEIDKFDQLCVITSDYHMPRTKQIFYSYFPTHEELGKILVFNESVTPDKDRKKCVELEKFLRMSSNKE